MGMQDSTDGFCPGYVDALTEVAKIGAYFDNPDEELAALEDGVHSISVGSLTIPNVLKGGKGRLFVSTTADSILLIERIPLTKAEDFWRHHEPEERYDFRDDGTVLYSAAPDGKKIDLAKDSPYPVEQVLRTPEELAALAAKLATISECVNALPPIDWSQNQRLAFDI